MSYFPTTDFVTSFFTSLASIAIRYYNVVYELLEEMENKVKVTLAPPPPGKLIGRAEILKSFRVGKSGKVAGCNVLEVNDNTERGMYNECYIGFLGLLLKHHNYRIYSSWFCNR